MEDPTNANDMRAERDRLRRLLTDVYTALYPPPGGPDRPVDHTDLPAHVAAMRLRNAARAGVILAIMRVLGDAPTRTEGDLAEAVQAVIAERDMYRDEAIPQAATVMNTLTTQRNLLRSALLDIVTITDPHDNIAVLAQGALDAVPSELDDVDATLQRGIAVDEELAAVEAERDRLQKVMQGSLIAIETILMGDHVDLGVGSGAILGRVSHALKQALGGEQGLDLGPGGD